MDELPEEPQESNLQAACPAQSPAPSGDVECDVCIGDKNKAVMSCLVCLNSYCQTHFEQHEKVNPGKRHNVTEATRRLQEMICPLHEKLLEIFCRADQTCICYLCMMHEHKKHDAVSVEAGRYEKQGPFGEIQNSFMQRLQEKEKELEELKEAVESHKRSAQEAVDDTQRVFSQLILLIERSRSELTHMIRDGEKTAVSAAEERMERLQQEINDLKRRNEELEELSTTQDHLLFLQNFQSLSIPPGSTDSSSFAVSSFDDVGKTVSLLREKLDQFCRNEMETISDKVGIIRCVVAPEPKTRDDFLQYFHQFTLDPNTANKKLKLSEEDKVVEYNRSAQSYPDHPDRFDYWWQVLCKENVCGRSYWELEWSDDVDVSVSYKNISRKGRDNECVFGFNDQSWSLSCSPHSFSFRHNNKQTELHETTSRSSRIGVYVDHSAGTLSFYNVSYTMSLIHTLQTTFTDILYPGFRIKHANSKVRILDLKIDSKETSITTI